MKSTKFNKQFSTLINLSKELLLQKNTKTKQDLNNFTYDLLRKEINDDTNKKTFWINIYNYFIKEHLKDQNKVKLYPSLAFFTLRDIEICNLKLSFNDIEHKILRKSKVLISMGFLSHLDITRPKCEKELRVNTFDNRIHFALNCGAKSCPKVNVYDTSNLEKQLQISERNFILDTTVYNKESNSIIISKIFL